MNEIKLNAAEVGAALNAYLVETGKIDPDNTGFSWSIQAHHGDVIIQGGMMSTVKIIIKPFSCKVLGAGGEEET